MDDRDHDDTEPVTVGAVPLRIHVPWPPQPTPTPTPTAPLTFTLTYEPFRTSTVPMTVSLGGQESPRRRHRRTGRPAPLTPITTHTHRGDPESSSGSPHSPSLGPPPLTHHTAWPPHCVRKAHALRPPGASPVPRAVVLFEATAWTLPHPQADLNRLLHGVSGAEEALGWALARALWAAGGLGALGRVLREGWASGGEVGPLRHGLPTPPTVRPHRPRPRPQPWDSPNTTLTGAAPPVGGVGSPMGSTKGSPSESPRPTDTQRLPPLQQLPESPKASPGGSRPRLSLGGGGLPALGESMPALPSMGGGRDPEGGGDTDSSPAGWAPPTCMADCFEPPRGRGGHDRLVWAADAALDALVRGGPGDQSQV